MCDSAKFTPQCFCHKWMEWKLFSADSSTSQFVFYNRPAELNCTRCGSYKWDIVSPPAWGNITHRKLFPRSERILAFRLLWHAWGNVTCAWDTPAWVNMTHTVFFAVGAGQSIIYIFILRDKACSRKWVFSETFSDASEVDHNCM